MMAPAQQEQVGKGSGSTIGPVHYVMGIAPGVRTIAPREPAVTIADDHGPSHGGRVVDDGGAAYLRADGLIERSGTSDSFPLLDALGSVRSVTDASGAVTASASYEAFGAVRSQTGSASAFGFTGEPTDATGLVYLRARTLDPATARFLQADSVRPGGPGTVGYNNLYAYATNDAATWVDPSGHETVAIQPAIGAMLIAFIRAIPGLCTFGPVAMGICIGVAIVSVGMVAMALLSLVLDCSSVPGCLDELLDDWT